MRGIAATLVLTLACGCSGLGQRWRNKPPSVADDLSFEPVKAAAFRLDNGFGVLLSPLAHPATTRVALVFDHGYADDGESPGRARLLAKWLQLEASAERSGMFDVLGAGVRTSVDATTTRLEVDVLSEDTPAAITALASLVRSAGDEIAFDSARRMRLATLAHSRRSPAQLATLAALESMLGGTGSGLSRRGLGSESALEGMAFANLLGVRDGWVAGLSAGWIVVGPHSKAQVRDWTTRATSSWPARHDRHREDVELPRRPAMVTIVPVPDLDPAFVVVGTTLPASRTLATEYAFAYGTAFARNRLRERLQWVYSISAELVDDGPIHVSLSSARVPAGEAYASARTMAGAYARMIREVEEPGLVKARQSIATSETAKSQNAQVHLEALARVYARRSPLTEELPFGPLDPQPSVAEVQRALSDEFSLDGIHIVIAGDLEGLKYQLGSTPYQIRTEIDLVGSTVLPDE